MNVEIRPYDPEWPVKFQQHAHLISSVLGPAVLQIEHIGSTSVAGLAAKPIVDILLVVADSAKESSYLPMLAAAGYELRIREPEFLEHRMFRSFQRDAHVHVLTV